MTVVLGYVFNGSNVGYPFKVGVNVSYTLSAAGLAVTIRAQNLMTSSSAPFMAGCHPYFRLLHGGLSQAKVVLDRSCTEWDRQGQTETQVPSGSASKFHAFNGSDTVLDPHLGCPGMEH